MKQLLCDMWLRPYRTLDSREKGNKQTCGGPSVEAVSRLTHGGAREGRARRWVGRGLELTTQQQRADKEREESV